MKTLLIDPIDQKTNYIPQLNSKISL